MQTFWQKIVGQLPSSSNTGTLRLLKVLENAAAAGVFETRCMDSFQSVEPSERLLDSKEPPYLPIETFRSREQADRGLPGELYGTDAQVRIFMSSGTTSEKRSLAFFSRDGLLLYKAQSLLTFFSLIHQVFGEDPLKVQGLSLVPPVSEWPDSSLAQMVAWIGELAPVEYLSGQTFTSSIDLKNKKPLWLFGTAFHLLNLIDGGKAKPLPPGSIVIETGGLKGKARQVSKKEFYREISAAFTISQRSIVSEYGMCELACQAYDWEGERAYAGKRQFRFPSWVRTAVVTGPGKIANAGRGALLIEDPMRIDFPLPLRTEDVAQLDPNGRFEIIGRIEKSPLKGCSLRVEEVVSAPSTVLAPSTHSLSSRADQNSFDFDKVTFVKRDILTRTKIIQTLLEDFCRNTETQNALARELGAKNAAITALKDTLECTPKKDSDWLTAVTTACGDDSLENPKHWLYILPNNHSLVGIYPLALAYVAGLDVTVRLPEKFASVDSLLQIFLRKLKPHMVNSQLTLEIKPSTFKLGKDPIPPSIGAVLCYGSDETIFAIKKICNIQVHGFGNRFTASVLNAAATQLDLKLQLAALVKDAFGLGQRGCLSTRVAFILNSKDLSSRALFQTFKDAFSSFWNAPLDSSVLLGHELESWRYKKMQAQNIDFANYDNSFPLMPIFKFDSVEEIPYDFIQKIVSRHPFVLPLVTITNTSCEENVKSVLDMIFDCNEVGQVSLGGFLEASQMLVKYRYRPRKLAPLGLANQLPWDGTHEGLPLFSLNKK